MRTSNPEKVFNFLEEIFELTKDKPVRLSLSQIITKHKLSSAYYKALLDTKTLINLNNLQRGATYEWGSVRPPNMYMANMLMHKVAEHNKQYNLSKKKPTPVLEDPEPEYRIVPITELTPEFVEDEIKPLIERMEVLKTERKCLYDGKEFMPRIITQKFCSDDCRMNYHNYHSNLKRRTSFNQPRTNLEPTLNQPKKIKKEVTPEKKEISVLWGLVKFKW